MLNKTSKVHELFHAMHEVVPHAREFDQNATFLRELITQKVISGKTTLEVFFQKDNATKWLDYLAKHYDLWHVREFYTILLEIPKNFEVDAIEHYQHPKIVDASANANSSADTRKQKWMAVMGPLVTSLDLLEMLWKSCADDDTEAIKALHAVGKALYEKL